MTTIRLLLVALCAVVFPGAANAQTKQVPVTRAEMALSFAPTVKKAAPAVVNVYALKRSQQRPNNPFMDDEFFRRFFGTAPQGSMPMERVQRSLGSGVIVHESGLVITNHHVINGADEIRVALNDRREFEAEVVLRDPRSDLAVLRLLKTKERFSPIEIADSDEVEVGDLVLAIGDPFGVGQTVTQGIVSATARTRVGITDFQFFIQTDAAINPGNSGGALVDVNGRLVGINTAIFSRSGGSHGIGFAIPTNMVKVVLASALAGNKLVARPYFGARLQPVTAEIAESLNLKRPAGALIASIMPASPAAKAGLRAGDVIIEVDGIPVDDPAALNYRYALKAIGSSANLTVERNGKTITLAIKLEAAPEREADEIEISARSPFSGARVSNFTNEIANRLRADPATAEGIVVVDISQGSTAERVGLRPGDVILEVNGTKIENTGDLDRLARSDARLWRITITRGGQRRSVVIRG
ncbi:MAG: DegQ family serine endoprotease [Xanthobacteraceae bacterium]|nr:DegQ family serine endoprotease [Xanthobacteraceae bacterium]MBX3533316.1 DegQ family serine endoprotease [Xanthobacteraceae bacterium]MCW5675999.1 DegQ family serine endoprotease [Xanthobacteraceae bacterium]MCW5679351.1 DegQ family serine endoprotease [Xanthobacteraceae bacterium]